VVASTVSGQELLVSIQDFWDTGRGNWKHRDYSLCSWMRSIWLKILSAWLSLSTYRNWPKIPKWTPGDS